MLEVIGSIREVTTGRHWSPREIHRQIELRVHRFQRLGLERGQRVLIHFGNQLEFFAELMAVWQLGGCVVPVDARLTAYEVRKLAHAAHARFSVVDDSTDPATLVELGGAMIVHTTEHESSRERPHDLDLRLDDDALILFTSGTTGDPKGVVHTHRSLRARWMTLRQALGLEPYRRTLCVLPTHFGHGLICNCLFPWLFGCDLYIAPPFKPDLLMQLGSVIDEHAITFVSSVPSMWNLALRVAAPPTRRSLQRIHVGSAPLSADMWSKVVAWSEHAEVLNAYGITETGSWVAGTTTGGELVPEDGLIGVPWGASIQILAARTVTELAAGAEACATGESGMIWLSTPALMKGYFRRDDLTQAAIHQGWFATGDLGLIDERGYLIIRGRERDEINKGGIKVFPAAIDLVAQESDQVNDVCTFGIEDPLYGENVAIALSLADDSAETIATLHRWLCERLAEHKQPEKWFLLQEIPRTSRGKINRDTVREICEQQQALDLKAILRKHARGDNSK